MSPQHEGTVSRLVQKSRQLTGGQFSPAMSPLAAFKQFSYLVPSILDEITAGKNPANMDDLCAEAIWLLGVMRMNLAVKDEFASSPEFSEALQKFRSRKANPSNEAETIHVR